LGSDHDNENFDFIKILTQIINNFSKFQQNKKIKIIYAEMVKVLRYLNIKEQRQPFASASSFSLHINHWPASFAAKPG
jgi:hypothetical protein